MKEGNKMTLWYTELDSNCMSYDASVKPRKDIEEIVAINYDSKPLSIPSLKPSSDPRNSTSYMETLTSHIGPEDTVFIQTPRYIKDEIVLLRMIHHRGAKVIGLVHDIDYYRGFATKVDNQIELLKCYDGRVVTGTRMRDILLEHGVNVPMTVMELWPYLINYVVPSKVNKGSHVINYAGYLGRRQDLFSNKIDNVDTVEVYGSKSDEFLDMSSNQVIYKGRKHPDDLPKSMSEGYGLVWYSDPKYYKYTTINVSHKASLYLVSDLPIIVRRESYLAEIVERDNLGIVVDKLSDIGSSLLSSDEYNKVTEHIHELSNRLLTTGEIFMEPFDDLFNKMGLLSARL